MLEVKDLLVTLRSQEQLLQDIGKTMGIYPHSHGELNSSHDRNELGGGSESLGENSGQTRVENSATLLAF